ncbi:MAG: SDR family NAD(P)-dependent oxidoreductase [Nostoc sp.]|uniref:SDR family NAD(P)-dependent oxidoreductase n=1 Tax=Nostoc sp. TaxID=1180 RepID=UPI002FF04F77
MQVEAVKAFALEHKVDLCTIELDVTSQESANAAVRTILDEEGRLDVVIHNAGHMAFGPAEAFTPEQFADLYNINVLGTQRVNRAALPILRAQGSGLVVWVSSTSTRGGTPPYLAPYFAAKAGMDSLAVNCAAGASKHQLSYPERLLQAPTILLMQASPTIKNVRSCTTLVLTQALATQL